MASLLETTCHRSPRFSGHHFWALMDRSGILRAIEMTLSRSSSAAEYPSLCIAFSSARKRRTGLGSVASRAGRGGRAILWPSVPRAKRSTELRLALVPGTLARRRSKDC